MLRKDRFDEREDDFYEAMYTQSQAQFDAYVESGTLLNNYSHVFDLLIKLRQARRRIWLFAHPTLTEYRCLRSSHQNFRTGIRVLATPPLQAVNHPYLVIYSPTSSSAAEHAQKALDAKAAAGLCPLCHDPFEVGVGHVAVVCA